MKKAVCIEIQRWEGPIAECEETHRIEGENVWGRANALLLRMSRTAPSGGGYDKTGFKVIYEDGEEYEGRLELTADKTPNIQNHMRSYCEMHTGRYRPAHMTEARYQNYLKDIVRPESKAAMEAFLDGYEMGPQPEPPTSAQGLWLAAMGVF